MIGAYVGRGAGARAPRPTTTVARRLLELRDVHVRFGPIRALDGVSLHVDEGEIVSLLGANAAGKSTLLRAVLGLVDLERGSVIVDGTDRTRATTAARIRAGLAYVRRARERRVALDAMYELFPRLRERAR